MAMAPERSKPLHNFSLPHLKWGHQRFLRCMKVNSTGEIASTDRRSSASEPESSDVLIKHFSESDKRSRSPSGFITTFAKPSSPALPPTGKSSGVKSKSKIERDGDDGGIEEIREKLMFHLRSAADKMKFAIPEETEGDESESAAAVAEAARPWNLRTRRAACKAPEETGGGSSKLEERQQKSLRQRAVASSSPGMDKKEKEEKKERRKFSIRLTRGEIEEDFAMMNGTRPSRRPKKRVKIVQKQLDTLFPGLWLTEITAESYKIPDEPDTKKRSR